MLCNFSCSRSSKRVSGPNCSVLNSFPVLWSCWCEIHCGSVAGGPAEPQHVPPTPNACGLRGSGEGSKAAPGTATSIVPLLLRAANLPVPARPCWPLRLCSTNPECRKITAAITALFICEAKSKIASDLGVRRDAKRGALCPDPQRV